MVEMSRNRNISEKTETFRNLPKDGGGTGRRLHFGERFAEEERARWENGRTALRRLRGKLPYVILKVQKFDRICRRETEESESVIPGIA